MPLQFSNDLTSFQNKKLKREPHLKDTLRKQLNKHQNSHKTLLKSDKKKKKTVTCLRQLFCLTLRLIS